LLAVIKWATHAQAFQLSQHPSTLRKVFDLTQRSCMLAELLMFWVGALCSRGERARARLWMGQYIDYGYEIPDNLMAVQSRCSFSSSTTSSAATSSSMSMQSASRAAARSGLLSAAAYEVILGIATNVDHIPMLYYQS
jgi:hypothetical protein